MLIKPVFARSTAACASRRSSILMPAGTAGAPRRLALMSDVNPRAVEARNMLGPVGEIGRLPALATVFQDTETGDWVVSARDTAEDGIHITVFNGPRARERALEY